MYLDIILGCHTLSYAPIVWTIMSSFVQLNWPQFDLVEDLQSLVAAGLVKWTDNQISLTTMPDRPNDYSYGCGSLYWDWANKYTVFEESNQSYRDVVPVRKPVLYETDFTELCTSFTGTAFEDAYNWMTSFYHVGRVRLMKLKPRTCLTWHIDDQPRLHYPMVTETGISMVIDGEAKHLPSDTWWWTNTTRRHTAFNGSYVERIHLVACILGIRQHTA